MYNIKYNSSEPSKTYDVNDLETKFFESLHSKLYTESLFYTPSLIRMTDGTLAVECGGYPVGKIKLQGRKHWMQILKNLYDNDIIEGSIDDFIAHQNEWVKYIKKYLLKELK